MLGRGGVRFRLLVGEMTPSDAAADRAKDAVVGRIMAGDPADHRALMHYTAINLRFPTSGNLPFSH